MARMTSSTSPEASPPTGEKTERAPEETSPPVLQGRVLVVDEERFARPGPRALDAVEELAGWLHR